MRLVKILLVVFVAGIIFACASAQEKAAKSEEAVNKERLELIDKYQKCVKKAGEDKDKEAKCEQYLKAADALR
jgi:hypothetical protein